MAEIKQVIPDPIEQQLPWITSWFTTPNLAFLNLNDLEKNVLSEISIHWPHTEKVALFNSLGMKFGQQVVYDVIDKVVEANIRLEWEDLARKKPSRTMDDFVRLLWEPLPSQGFDITIEKQTNGIQIHCSRCPHAELARQIGSAELLYHLVCSGDQHAAAGFNPKIGFRRTQTLMEGHPCCNHYYYMKD
jgi:hypothetical protein